MVPIQMSNQGMYVLSQHDLMGHKNFRKGPPLKTRMHGSEYPGYGTDTHEPCNIQRFWKNYLADIG